MSLLPITQAFATLKNPISLTIGYTGKDRYNNICPVAATHVKLSRGYINANHIHILNQRYICCQAPMKNTVADMWRMIWEYQCPVIVMLASYSDINRGRATIYWPQTIDVYDDIEVSVINIHQHSDDITVRTLKLRCNGMERIVTHTHFTSWPDFGVPATTTQFINLLTTVNAMPHNSPIVVHCSAGIGRSGVFIAVHAALKSIRQNPHIVINIKDIVETMRQYRNGMVQTEDQYKFIEQAINHELTVQQTLPLPPLSHDNPLSLPFMDINTFLLLISK